MIPRFMVFQVRELSIGAKFNLRSFKIKRIKKKEIFWKAFSLTNGFPAPTRIVSFGF